MLTTAHSVDDRSLVIDRSTHCIRLERTFDAPPAQVFEAWTRPEHVSCWWDPAGQPLAVCEIDLRQGGTFTFASKERPDMPFAGTYLEIVPFERLTFEALGAIGRVLIEEAGEGARLTVEIQCRSAEHLQQFLELGVDKGTAGTLDNLVAYIRARAR
ncbi:SRPBCC family protein [Labrys wisconsinensis]|uniref:Uncharacterized protein YndB with AHSA1/START domain n=1 Tax=Labrys wisconsinensis TaxID=425677 RepID=A0ABU0JEJ5_9HYPH|nr:SRPBCC domain-containing protein [Labrys wisconsinensis]MDQ0472699.1 uncharacterized protein YndB with AHSA1/START domain [Labrys wisconsinensis]